MRYLRDLWMHRALVGYITLVLILALVFYIRQARFNDRFTETNRQVCLALQGNVEAQRLALLALIRIGNLSTDPAFTRELPYLRLALDALDTPRCAR